MTTYLKNTRAYMKGKSVHKVMWYDEKANGTHGAASLTYKELSIMSQLEGLVSVNTEGSTLDGFNQH